MTHLLSKFTVHFGNELSAEASELGYCPGEVPGKRIWQDSCDLGLKIKSDKTGKVFTFLFHKYMPNMAGWIYIPYEKGCPCPTLSIYNG
jgi:hypothetical protein